MKILVFDIWSQYGHFKVPYTTTSPISLPIPPKTSVYGMLGALIGLDKDSYLKEFQKLKCRIAVSLRNPVKKTHIPENLIDTKKAALFAFIKTRTQIKIEFLQSPKFRLYVYHSDDEIYSKIKENLENHKSVYTLSMGLSECLANYEYIGEFEADEKHSSEFESFSSIIPFEVIENQNDVKILEENRKFMRTHLSLEMKENRELLKTGDFLIEANGHKINAKVKNSFLFIPELEENIILF